MCTMFVPFPLLDLSPHSLPSHTLPSSSTSSSFVFLLLCCTVLFLAPFCIFQPLPTIFCVFFSHGCCFSLVLLSHSFCHRPPFSLIISVFLFATTITVATASSVVSGDGNGGVAVDIISLASLLFWQVVCRIFCIGFSMRFS